MTDGDVGAGGRDENAGPHEGSAGPGASAGTDGAGASAGGAEGVDGAGPAGQDGGTPARPDGGQAEPDGGGSDEPPDDGSGPSRRWVLAAVAGGTAFSSPVVGAGADEPATGDPSLHVRVYPGPTPIQARLRQGGSGLASGWTNAHEAAIDAVEDALEQVSAYAAAETSLGDLSVEVERREPVGGWLPGTVSPLDAITGADDVYDGFRERVRERDLATGDCAHLLLWWDGTNYALGYGGTRPGTGDVAANEEEGAHAVANVGATEAWDSRAVTRNMAIHETLHAFLTDDVVADVVGSRCDHHLGTAVATGSTAREVSPMATAYAGPDAVGGGTRWHGSGCYDHDSFYRHDGTSNVTSWEYTTELSEATLEAVTRYVRRYLVD